MKKRDLSIYINKKYGRWTILKEGIHKLYPKGYISYMNCQCECGSVKNVELNSILRGKSVSCGCYNKEIASKNATTHGLCMTSDKEKHPDYGIWIKVKSRCYNLNDKNYKHYGAKGIKVCDRWKNSFENFINDLGWRPSKKYSLERIDYNGDYDPVNCKWILKSHQSRNTSRTLKITHLGKTLCLLDWCKVLKLDYSKMRYRITDLKMTFEDAMNTKRIIKK